MLQRLQYFHTVERLSYTWLQISSPYNRRIWAMNNARVFKLLSGPERKCLLPASVTGYQQLIHNSAGLCTCHWPVGLLKGLFWFPSHTSQPQLAARVSLGSHDWWVTDVFVNPAAVVCVCVCVLLWGMLMFFHWRYHQCENRAKSQMYLKIWCPCQDYFGLSFSTRFISVCSSKIMM